VIVPWAVLLVGIAALGFVSRRTAPPLARWCGLLVVLAFAIAAAAPVAITFATRPAVGASVELAGPVVDSTSLLAAAARAGSRSEDLSIVWKSPAVLPRGPVGASVAFAGTALPLSPEALQARLLRPAVVDRPTALQVEAEGLHEPLLGLLIVRSGDREVLRRELPLAAGTGEVFHSEEIPFLPSIAGEHTVELQVICGAHTIVRAGAFFVAEAPRVLVWEPSGNAAAALQAQGVAVESIESLPTDWQQAAALVLGVQVPVAVQSELVTAVRDGLGLFVLEPGFAAPGEPLRELLPLRPAPTPATEAGESGTGPADPTAPPPTEPPPTEPPPTPPKHDKPPEPKPDLDPREAGPVSDQPIEVDKHTIAMVLVIDRSGSMGESVGLGRTKMDYAKASAWQTAKELMQGDEVGVVTFGNKGMAQVELLLTDAQNLPVVRTGIEKLAAAREQTYLLSGLEVADRMLQASTAAVKHVVVVTDGEFDTTEAIALRRLAWQMNSERHQTVSILSIVSPRDGLGFQRYAEEITRDGGGQFLAMEDASRVPSFVSAEVARALSRVGRKPRTDGADADPAAKPVPKPPPVEKPPEPQPQPPRDEPQLKEPVRIAVHAIAEVPILQPEPADGWPSLGAAVAGTAPLDAQVLLVAGDAGWPLLAYGNRGLGRVGAFAADLCGAAGAEFRAETEFSARLSLWVQDVLRAEPERSAAPLLVAAVVTPPAPSPQDLAALEALAGSAPRTEARPIVSGPVVTRVTEGRAVPWSLAALLALLALGLLERWLGVRALLRG
jgi:Mg-chelatase subunit ChlD